MRIATINTASYQTQATDIKIDQRFTATTVKRASRFDYRLGTDVVDVLVGVIENGSASIETLNLTIPMRRLLNGRQADSIRTIRFNHLLNILTSWASETQGVDLGTHSVVFLGFRSDRLFFTA